MYGGASRAPIGVGYLLSVASVGLAAAAAVQFSAAFRGSPLPLLLLAVVLSAWLGGPGPGILAAVLGTVSFDYLLTVPSLASHFGDLNFPFRLVIYVIVVCLIVLLSNAERLALAGADQDRRRWQQILDVLPQSVLLLDPQGRCVHANAAARQLFGHDRPVPDGRKGRSRVIVALDFRDAEGRPIDNARLPFIATATKGQPSENVMLMGRDVLTGDDIYVLASSAPLFDERNVLTGAVAIFQDIRTLRDLDIQKEEFLAAVAHDLRNPLTNIRGHAQLLLNKAMRNGGAEMPAFQRSLERIDTATMRLSAMIDEFVDIGRLHMNRPLELERRWTDLLALVGTVVEDYREANPKREFRLTAEGPTLAGEWDDARIRRVLDNLLNNAVKYSAPDTPISVEVSAQGDGGRRFAVVRVADKGLGIPSTDLPRIFERFHRAENVRGRVAGTGIGLAGARWIAEEHHGDLTVESEEGKGSVFTLRLPLPPPQSATPIPKGEGNGQADLRVSGVSS